MSGVATEAVQQGSGEPLQRKIARLLARNVRTRTTRTLAHAPMVSFTFDDIPESAAECGAAILEEAGARGTFYVAGSLVGTVEPKRRLADSSQCRGLHQRGHEIACHTFSHRAVSDLSRRTLADDITRNADVLGSIDDGIAPANFAYPFNTTSLRAKWQLERHFVSCRGGVPGINSGRIDLGYLRAVELADQCIEAEAVRSWIARAVETRGWLIFFSHGISERSEAWGCHPDLLRFAIAEAQTHGAAIVTVREALRLALGDERAGAP